MSASARGNKRVIHAELLLQGIGQALGRVFETTPHKKGYEAINY
jgi:hypothetical protein